MSESYRCLDCKHLQMEYEPDWSDITPGSGLTFECVKNQWDSGRQRDFSKSIVKQAFLIGDTCKEFEGGA